MASYLRPRRGKNATATAQSIVLKKGEVFFEIAQTGISTGSSATACGKIKMGDGATTYSNLGYFVDVDTSAVAWSNAGYTDATSAAQGADLYGNLNALTPTATVKTLFTNIKALLYKMATKVTTLEKDGVGQEVTQAQYNALPEAKKVGTFFIKDAPGAQINIDTALNSTSSNPVQNSVITNNINRINSDLGAKVAGFTSGSYTKVTGLAYDSTNKKLGLKVNGADTVIPFSSGVTIGVLAFGGTSSNGQYTDGGSMVLSLDGSMHEEPAGSTSTVKQNLSNYCDFMEYVSGSYWKAKKAGNYYGYGVDSSGAGLAFLHKNVGDTITFSNYYQLANTLVFIPD